MVNLYFRQNTYLESKRNKDYNLYVGLPENGCHIERGPQ